MNVKEKELVTEDYCARNDTYNLSLGGIGGWNYINANNLSNTEELKQRKRESCKRYWTDERKKEKSLFLKEYYELNGTKQISDALRKRYEKNKENGSFDIFVRKMTDINKGKDKRCKAGNSIKELWKTEEYRNNTLAPRYGCVWWNDGVNTVKRHECPGPEWSRGRLDIRKPK